MVVRRSMRLLMKCTLPVPWLAGMMVWWAAWGSALGQAPEVLVELDQEQAFVGEPVDYRVLLNHCGMESEPDMSAFDAFDVKLVSRSQIQSSRSIRNGGRRQQVVRIGPLFEYQLRPRRAGRIEIPGPTVQVDGTTYQGRVLSLQVADIDDQDLVYLEVTTEPESVYPLQPFQVRLTMAIKSLPEPAAETDPLRLRRRLPLLTIPWADDDFLDDALQPQRPLDRWIRPYVDDTSFGVSINNYQGAMSGFSGFFGSLGGDNRLAFRPQPRRVRREDRRGRLVEYWEYVFERTVIPQRPGPLSLGMVTIKGQFAARINTRGNVELETVYAIARPPALEIKEPPREGRPSTYAGAIGSFVGGAELTPTEASVGDPMTLTLWVRGTGTLNQAAAPNLAAQPDLAAEFKVYEATEQTEEETRRFTYSLRPKAESTTVFPAVPILTYFDVESEAYVTLESDPIPIAISPASQLATSEIAMAVRPHGQTAEIGVLSDGIYANVTDLAQFRNDGVNPRRWFLGMGGLAGLFVVIALVSQRWQRWQDDHGRQRRKSAGGRARQRLAAAEGSDVRQAAEAISDGLVGLVADACDLDENGLTSAEAARELEAQGVPPSLVERLTRVLEACDGMRYASVGVEFAAVQREAEGVLADLVQDLRSRKLVA